MDGGRDGLAAEDVAAESMLRRTVAVVDMVGYSTIARMLEQNISASSVAELNRQIQGLIGLSLQQLPRQDSYTVLTRTGDGIILLFDEPDAAHWFGVGMHRAAKKHNDHRTESTAQRWFRVGIATGDLSAASGDRSGEEYAGTAIANAVRLESAAGAGEILMDEDSFDGLSAGLQAEYGPVEVVKGKREERFRARRFRVTSAEAMDEAAGGSRSGRREGRRDGLRGQRRAGGRRRLLRRAALGAVYLIALIGLLLWEDRQNLDAFTPSCEAATDAGHTVLYSKAYQWFLARAAGEGETPVRMVVIPAKLTEIQGNSCVGRMYLADLLRSIAGQHPAVIVVDKSFAPSSCSFLPAATAELVGAAQSVGVPMVVGESTDTADVERGGACLVRKPQLEFDAANVHRAIARLDPEYETIPLQWEVMRAQGDARPPVDRIDSLAWATVQLYDPAFAARPSVKRLVASAREPFADLSLTIPRLTSTEVLCSVGTKEMQARWSERCVPGAALPSLLGKVVFIGSEDAGDRQQLQGAPIFGFELQARYIQALLAGAYLRQTSLWLAILLFVVYLVVMEGLPLALEAWFEGGVGSALLRSVLRPRRYGWVTGWTLVFLVLTSAISLAAGYLPPLVLFGDIVLVATTRLLLFTAQPVEKVQETG